ncbi:MAG: hypothetical protein K2P88_16970, partial [Chitinophagaceae bacterium]|nr:hypothetical protein [Chitinophagaceae bacterium]
MKFLSCIFLFLTICIGSQAQFTAQKQGDDRAFSVRPSSESTDRLFIWWDSNYEKENNIGKLSISPVESVDLSEDWANTDIAAYIPYLPGGLVGQSLSPSTQNINYGGYPSTISGTSATGGTTPYTYLWQSAPSSTGPWTDISGTNSTSYTPNALTSSTYYRRKVTDAAGAFAYSSNTGFVNVYPQLTVTIDPTTQTITSGGQPTTLYSEVFGGSGTYTFQWQRLDGSTWTNVATTANFTPPTLTATTSYRVIVTSNGASVTSSASVVNVTSAPTASLAVTNTTPSGNGSINTLTCTAGAGNGTYSYAWYYSTDNGATYQAISNTTSSYTTGVVTATTKYYVSVTSNGQTTSSNIVTLDMPTTPTISAATSTTLCNGASVVLTASGYSGTIQWYNGSNTLVGTGTSFSSSTSNSYYAVGVSTYGRSANSNSITTTALTTPTGGTIQGSTQLILGSTNQLTNTSLGGNWSTSNSSIISINSFGTMTGKAIGTASLSYTQTNACGTGVSTMAVSVVPITQLNQTLGVPVYDNTSSEVIPLTVNAISTREYVQDGSNSRAHFLTNIIALSVIEETSLFIPGDFTASVTFQVQYGHTSNDLSAAETYTLDISYTKNGTQKYKAKNYISFKNAEYVKVTVIGVTAPTTVNGLSFDTKQVLRLENIMDASRSYELADNKVPTLAVLDPATINEIDSVKVKWTLAPQTNGNAVQLEWTWVDSTMEAFYSQSGSLNTELLFRNNSTRIDLPISRYDSSYSIPLFYDGGGKLYTRVRAVNFQQSGTRSDGPWSTPVFYAFKGHSPSLNWQSTTSFAEEGKRKTVIQYYDGSLRSRQTVTKDNTSSTVVAAETLYDGAGRPAIQILPAPTMNSVLKYYIGLNKFNGQSSSADDMTQFFDFSSNAADFAVNKLDTTVGTGNYYSTLNPLVSQGINKNIPLANGYAYTVTRYTPDATGRIMRQSGVGESMAMGGDHDTRYYYGTVSQEELDGLFGTEAGYASHYFKNMVRDANGQMSISYLDMRGKTVATALTGPTPTGMQDGRLLDSTKYPNQNTRSITRNLLDKHTNTVKGNTVEATNTILVGKSGMYNLSYVQPKKTLVLPKCGGGTVSFNCYYDLQVSIFEESSDTAFRVKTYLAKDSINYKDSFNLVPGSYTIRKTLTINQDSLKAFMAYYNTVGIGICKSFEQLTDSIVAVDSLKSNCSIAVSPVSAQACQDSLGTYASFLAKKAAQLGTVVDSLKPDLVIELRSQYVEDSTACLIFNPNRSSYLDQIKEMMLADMAPYSGQYAKKTVDNDLDKQFNIFSTFYATGSNRKPYYKYPKNNGAVDFKYKDYKGLNEKIDSAALSTMTQDQFEDAFYNSWSNSLIEYHPEYQRLKYAQDNLKATFNFHDSVNNLKSAFNPFPSDPFFTNIASSTDATTMSNYVSSNWKNGWSMWQVAYGNAVGCAVKKDTASRGLCYRNMPKTMATVGTSLTIASGVTVLLTNTLQEEAWGNFKSSYLEERLNLINKKISETKPISATDSLINLQYRVYFVNNRQQSFNLIDKANPGYSIGSWATITSPAGIPSSVTTAANDLTNKCASYIDMWRTALLQCPALASYDQTKKEAVLNSITAKLLDVCQRGTDASNPNGASTVAPSKTAGATYLSFEKAVDFVFDSLGLGSSRFVCNPYNIGFPRPHGVNRSVAPVLVSSIDSCNCGRFAALKLEMIAANRPTSDTANLYKINRYLDSLYRDTISVALYQTLQQCGSYYMKIGSSGNLESSYSIPVDTLFTLPIPLVCGFDSLSRKCYTCTEFKALEDSFYLRVSKRPNFYSENLSDSLIAINVLFEKYVNFKTGLETTWQDMANLRTSSNNPCDVGRFDLLGTQVTANTNTPPVIPTKICFTSTKLYDSAYIPKVSKCAVTREKAGATAGLLFDVIKQQTLDNFFDSYMSTATSVSETMELKESMFDYHFTLYYYDQAGNLIKTVPPKGVNPDYSTTFLNNVKTARANGTVLVPAHSLVTRYNYNSLNQVVLQKTPDGGMSEFWYDALGRLVVSQNAKQKAIGGTNVYSYTLYDSLGRISEVGQLSASTVMVNGTSKSPSSLNTWVVNASSTKSQITKTTYDVANPNLSKYVVVQKNLRNRVSYTEIYDTAQQLTNMTPAAASYYTYDIHGNVDTLVQDFGSTSAVKNIMNNKNNRFKKIAYFYDLVSGKVNQVTYQPDYYDSVLAKWITPVDQYHHRYKYDAENKLIEVVSGRDSVMLAIFPEREAAYNYYKHGPLARTELGKLRVQGLDFVYTLQGWIKAVNPVKSGTFTNGTDSTEAFPVAQDVFGYSLNYYEGDYRAIGYAPAAGSIISKLGASAAPLYNGNIAAMSVNIPVLGGGAKVYNYKYDQLNRIVSMDLFDGLAIGNTNYALTQQEAYKERVSYDPNGNILTYLRNGAPGATTMDNMTYSYTAGTNKLHKVVDAAANNAAYSDIKTGQNDNNYQYDAIGNLIADGSENITNISWNVYGKISTITKGGATISYKYDASGNRILKMTAADTTAYVRDASGNVMAVYVRTVGADTTLKLMETHLYGSSRLGMVTRHNDIDSVVKVNSNEFGNFIKRYFTRGEKLFELSNHLGNVLVTITDRRQQVSAGGSTVDSYLADINSASDYYPFGMLMPNRSYTAGSQFRYGFNGQE